MDTPDTRGGINLLDDIVVRRILDAKTPQVLADSEGRIVLLNELAERMLELNWSQLVGQPLMAIVPANNGQRYCVTEMPMTEGLRLFQVERETVGP